jgi:dienelactone hydrolase
MHCAIAAVDLSDESPSVDSSSIETMRATTRLRTLRARHRRESSMGPIGRTKRFAAWAGLAWLLGAAMPSIAEELTLRYPIEGKSRRVLLHVPDHIGAVPPPLVIVYHGRGDDSAKFAAAVKLHKDWPEAIVAYPRGERLESVPMRGWQYRRGQFADRDLQLTDALLKDLAQRYGTRPETSYVAGFSNGGHFVLLLLKERPRAFAAFAALGAVQPDYASDAPPRPLLYLFGRGEDREYQDDWAGTVEALVRHNRTQGPLRDFLSCCKLQSAGRDGAPLVFGTYNAGHIWPSEGNAWLKQFFQHAWPATPSDAPRPDATD